MKKNLFTSLSLIALITSVASSVIMFNSAKAAQPAAVLHLPAGLLAPAKLPAAIQDAELLEAWVRLYSHTDPIQLWDGTSTSGRALAEYLRDHDIPVVWGTAHDCNGYSCSVKLCTPDGSQCAYNTSKTGVAPIYIRAGEHGDMPALTDTLAHEIFHRTQPFGPVADTRFEEYWAFRVENHINAEPWLTFGNYDPLDPNHLSMWIRENKMNDYLSLRPYPASVAQLVASSNSQSQSQNSTSSSLPAAALGASE